MSDLLLTCSRCDGDARGMIAVDTSAATSDGMVVVKRVGGGGTVVVVSADMTAATNGINVLRM